MENLQAAEASGDVKNLASLFTADAELKNLTRPSHCGRPLQFWQSYIKAFDRVSSTFDNVIDDGKTAVLEWQSHGILPMGIPITYRGVSIIEYVTEPSSQENGKIVKFRTVYDSAALMSHLADDHHYSKTVGLPQISTDASS